MDTPPGVVAATQWLAVTQSPVATLGLVSGEFPVHNIAGAHTIYHTLEKMKTILSLFILTVALAARSQTNPVVQTDQQKLITITNTIHMYATNCDALAVRIQRLGFMADGAKQTKAVSDAQKYSAEQTKLMNQYVECERRIAVLQQEADRIKRQAAH